MMKTSDPTRRAGAAGVCLCAALAFALTPGNAQAATTTATVAGTAVVGGHCVSLRIPVALGPGQPAAQTVAGTLCLPDGRPTATVDVLVHGAGYDQAYWNWPVDPGLYSYVDETLAAGRATFAYDRIGAGGSSHPLSTLITTDADAYVLHQLVGDLRRVGYGRVDVVGHSFGSIIAVDEAAAYRDVDRLVVTGLLHPETAPPYTPTSVFYPAYLDPQFAGEGLDPGYLTTIPGTRAAAFYSSSADPAVIAYDEAHKDTVSGTELVAGLAASQLPPTLNAATGVRAPVLVVDGDQDALFCGFTVDCADPAAVSANERAFYSAAASVAVSLIPATGHSLALHPSAPQSFAVIDQWLASDTAAGSADAATPAAGPSAAAG